jgi:GcrA cell cycle regulator
VVETTTPAHGGEKMPWTEERVETLSKLWADGLSASKIAAKLGMGVTRNAVIGKVHRLNLAGRAAQPRTAEPRSPRKTREPSHPGRPSSNGPTTQTAGNTVLKPFVRPEPRPQALAAPQPLRLLDLPKDGRITILHLSDKTCKWPIGDPGAEDFCFCGHSPRDASPYCEYHARLAYQPMQDRRHRKSA